MTPPVRLGSTWHPSPTHLSCCLIPAPSSGSEPAALKKNRLMQLGKEGRWAAGPAPQACLLTHQPRAQQGRYSRVNECPSVTHGTDPCVCDTNILCHTAGARGLNHPPHRASQRHSHPAVALMPVSSAAQSLAGPPLLPRGHHQTQKCQMPPEVKLAKGFLKRLLGFASH